jgi:hypothetical protein
MRTGTSILKSTEMRLQSEGKILWAEVKIKMKCAGEIKTNKSPHSAPRLSNSSFLSSPSAFFIPVKINAWKLYFAFLCVTPFKYLILC